MPAAASTIMDTGKIAVIGTVVLLCLFMVIVYLAQCAFKLKPMNQTGARMSQAADAAVSADCFLQRTLE